MDEIKGAIFDLDGTLVSTAKLHIKAWVGLFDKYKIALSRDELKEQSGLKNVIFIQRILERRGIKNLDANRLSKEKDRGVIKVLETNPVEIFLGAKAFLMKLKARNIKLALATSATKQTAKLLCGQIINYFDVKIFAEDVTKGKPDPEIFIKAANRLGLKSENVVVFEDAKNGVAAAKAGGFFCIAKDNKSGQDISAADLIIKNYSSPKLPKRLNII